MSVYQMAAMLAGQFALVLQHDPDQRRGTIRVIPDRNRFETDDTMQPGVFIHPKDAEY